MPAERSRRSSQATRTGQATQSSRSDRTDLTGRPGRLAGLVVAVLLLGLAAWTVVGLQPPDPRPADAPAGEFSAARAFAHVQRIAADVHVTGSPENDRVVEDLVATLTGLGLDTRVQNAVGVREGGAGEIRMARVRNVVGVLPGADPTGRLYLMAHHDSADAGPGAADDAAGVAALLESVRALTAGPRLSNDVVVVLTDAEEACLCGAEAFAASHPLAGGGVVLNFEARGTSGPPIMFETSPRNADLAAVFAEAAPHPVASSFAVEVYRALPNDTDFSVLLDDGDFAGMNTAFIDGAAGYHSPQDTPERLDRRTLQALGDNALALARELGDRDLAALARPAAEDATYFPLPGSLVRYPGTAVWPLAAAALVAVAGLALTLRARGTSSLRRTGGAALLALVPLALAPLAAQGMWAALVAVRPGYAGMLDPWRPGWFRLAAVAVVLAVVLVWYALLRRRVGPAPLAAGALVWLAVLAVVLAAVAPGGSYLAAWPALVGALTGILAALARSRAVQVLAALLTGAAAVLVLAPTAALFFPALGLSQAAAPSVVVVLAALALLPAAELLFPDPEADPSRRTAPAAVAVPATAVVLAAACAFAGLTVDRFDAAHPVPSRLAYLLDADRGEARWVSTETTPGEWTGRFVDGPGTLGSDYPYLAGRDVLTGPAEAAALPAPEVTVLSDEELGGRRELSLRVRPRREDVRLVDLTVTVDAGTVMRGRIGGRALPDTAVGGGSLRVTFHAPPADGLQVALSVEGDGPVRLRVTDAVDGLTGLPGHEPRPEGVDVAGAHGSDLVLVTATTDLG
ncbi:M20/M25/M40 family metallo-hydrolase [Blastococcus saxobsidens]|uniref:Peptidase M28-like protein n=1 Tax=Blastococcus saxobsidens TaxID=138336 RepID=A0A4V2G219_9ACTN|nr:M20/M25/M40 family metallo-hydrolase [Blastococcus saxobsidens]RZU31396.1 peptidase M28-like protein [Blastococcus saxobsidens]